MKPNCCATARDSGAVIAVSEALSAESFDRYVDRGDRPYAAMPWVMVGSARDTEDWCDDGSWRSRTEVAYVAVRFCPFCGAELPASPGPHPRSLAQWSRCRVCPQ